MKIRGEIAHTEDMLRQDDADMIDFQRKNHIVINTGDTNGGGSELSNIRHKLADLRSERDQLALTSPEQSLTNPIPRRAEAASGNASSPQEQTTLEGGTAASDYRQAKVLLARAQAELDDFSRDLRPKHPKIVSLNAEIDRQQKALASLIKQNGEANTHRLALVDSLIATTEQQVKDAESKTLNNDLLRAEYEQKAAKKDRDMKGLSELQVALRNGSLSTNVNQDEINVVERASVGRLVPSSWIKIVAVALIAGLAGGVGMLMLIDRMDDRLNSLGDLQMNFDEHVVGQIPRDPRPVTTPSCCGPTIPGISWWNPTATCVRRCSSCPSTGCGPRRCWSPARCRTRANPRFRAISRWCWPRPA